jgi:hypothetical protein
MIEIIAALVSLVVHFISYLFSTGEDKEKAKADLKEVVNGTHGKILVGFFRRCGSYRNICGYLVFFIRENLSDILAYITYSAVIC